MTAKIVPERVGLDGVHSRDVYYAYDLRGLQTEARFGGPAGEGVSNAWDGFGRLVSTTTSMGGMSRTIAHRFDREGRDVELTFPDGHKFWSRRDGLGRMVESYHGPLGDPATEMAGFHYDAAAQLHRIGRRWAAPPISATIRRGASPCSSTASPRGRATRSRPSPTLPPAS